MTIILISIFIAAVLFGSTFMARRRFGLLGLALAAGSLLSSIWGYDVDLVVSGLGVLSSQLTSAVVSSLIILLPAGALLFHGYTYKNLIGRIVGASLFTLLAFAFLIEPLGHVLVLQGTGAVVYSWLVGNRTIIIGLGMVIAVVDIFLTKPVKLSEKRH